MVSFLLVFVVSSRKVFDLETEIELSFITFWMFLINSVVHFGKHLANLHCQCQWIVFLFPLQFTVIVLAEKDIFHMNESDVEEHLLSSLESVICNSAYALYMCGWGTGVGSIWMFECLCFIRATGSVNGMIRFSVMVTGKCDSPLAIIWKYWRIQRMKSELLQKFVPLSWLTLSLQHRYPWLVLLGFALLQFAACF